MQAQEHHIPSSREGDALFQALEKEGCPVCLVTLEAMQRAMDYWLYEGFSDADNRQRLIRSHGFCARHTWQLAQLPASFQLAQVYQTTLSETLTSLTQSLELVKRSQQTSQQSFWRTIWHKARKRREGRDIPSPQAPCTFCQTQHENEERLASTILTMLASETFLERLRLTTTGFCLPHFTRMYEAANNNAQRSCLLESQCLHAQYLQHELAELIRKHDYRFLKEPQGEDMTSWRRAAKFFIGHDGVR